MNNIIVTESSSNIRILARKALEGNWKKSTLVIILYLVCAMAPALIIEFLFGSLNPEYLMSEMTDDYIMSDGYFFGSTLSSLYAILVTGAFSFGVALFFIHMIRVRNAEYGDLFSGFGHLLKTIGLYFMISLFTFLWMLLFIVPGVIAAYRYSMAFFVLADDPSKGVMQCIRESKVMMKGNKAKLFCLEMSFIPWILLAYFAFVILVAIGAVAAYMVPVVGIIVIVIGFIIFLIGVCVIMAYMYGAMAVLFEMVTGRLVAAPCAPTAPGGSYN